MPTGMLQKAFAHLNSTDTLAGEFFGGGVVRVDRTDSSHLGSRSGFNYPGEVYAHTPSTKHMLRSAGHTGRYASRSQIVAERRPSPPSPVSLFLSC